jgi:hypothetical protein
MGKKIKVVLDTNVWVSIFMKKTLAEEFSKLFETRKINVYNSEAILNEISKVLMYPKINDIVRLSWFGTKDIIQSVIENSIIVKPKHKINAIKEDVEDNKILECAIQANVDFIVSGDAHLIRLKEFKKIKIVTPREFLEIISTSK